MIGFVLLGGGLIAQWMLGVALATAVLGKRIWTPRNPIHTWALVNHAELTGLGILLGIAGTSYGQFLWSWAGGTLGRSCSLALAAVGFVGFGIVWWTCRAKATEQPADSENERAWIKFACSIVILLFFSQLTQALLTPQRLWDERAIFGLKALVLYEDRSVRSPDLLHDDFVQYHPRYPLLIPLTELHIYGLIGTADDRWAKLVFPLLSLGLSLTFAGVLQRHMRPGAAWLWTLVLATVPMLAFDDYGFLSGQADAPVAAYHGLCLLYLWDWLRSYQQAGQRATRTLLFAAFAAGMTLFNKDEGIAFFVVDLALIIPLSVLSLRGTRGGALARWGRALRAGALFAAATVLPLIPWWLHRRELPGTTEMSYSGRLTWPVIEAGLPTLWWSVPHLARRMFLQMPEMGWQWWGMLLAGLSHIRRACSPEQLLLLGDVTGALAALLVAGMIAPTPVEEHLGGSSHRFLMQLAPAAVLFMAGQFHGIQRDSRVNPDRV